MLRYSYKVEIASLEKDILLLQMDLVKNPNNTRAKKMLSQKMKDKQWFESRKDPGAMIL